MTTSVDAQIAARMGNHSLAAKIYTEIATTAVRRNRNKAKFYQDLAEQHQKLAFERDKK